jgi:methyl-galactoside transport system permease protein
VSKTNLPKDHTSVLTRYSNFLIDNAIYLIMFLLLAVIIAFEPTFVNLENFNAILSQSSTRIIFALGAAGIIVLGGTDLSIGRAVGFAGVIAASMLQAADYGRRIFTIQEMPPVATILFPIALVMIVIASISFLQGVVVAKLNVAPFIASLGFSQIIYGICSLYFNGVCKSAPISGFDSRFTNFAQGNIKIFGTVPINFIMIYALIIAVLIWFIWNKTVLGKNLFAIGGNREAAKVSGVNIVKNILIIYTISGLLYGFGGTLEAARTGSAVNSLGAGYELDAIAACVVGGVSMRGGTGTVLGVVLGVIIFQIINYGLIYIGVSPDLQYVVKGGIIVIAVAIDSRKYLRRS